MKIDRRTYNDNSRDWNNKIQEERKKALKEVCNIIILKDEPRTFAHVAKIMKLKFDKNIAITAQTISQNYTYRKIYETAFLSNNIENNQKKRKHDPKSTIELKHELHSQKVQNKKLHREINILRHQIKQSNIKPIQNEYQISDINIANIQKEAIATLIKELLYLGDFFISQEGLKRERDHAIILSNKILVVLDINLKDFK